MIFAKRFQRELTTGRLTLPVSVLLSLLLWSRNLNSTEAFINLMVFALIGYLLIEINTIFTLIRNRTTLHACLFWLISGICIFLHPFRLVHLIPLAFMVALFQLFGSYEQDNITSNGPEEIEWIVLDKQDGKILLLSRYILFKDGSAARDWFHNPIRSQLNSDFFSISFTPSEQERICTVSIQEATNISSQL